MDSESLKRVSKVVYSPFTSFWAKGGHKYLLHSENRVELASSAHNTMARNASHIASIVGQIWACKQDNKGHGLTVVS